MKHLPLILAWTIYFLLHSVFASQRLKRWSSQQRPAAARYYRLIYNIVASILILPPLYLTYSSSDAMLWTWQGSYYVLVNILAFMALAGFFYSLRGYDGMDFLGIRQLQTPTDQAPKPVFCIGFFHRFVRHPWYFFALIIIWTRDMNTPILITSILITTYFFIGSRLEEEKLVQEFGERYKTYKRKVPGLIPLPWKRLSQKEARELTEET